MDEQIIKSIGELIESAIAKFQKNIPGIQNAVFDELQNLTKELASKNGKILTNVENLKLIGAFKNKLKRIIVSNEYTAAVKEFIKTFDQLQVLHNNYFASFNAEFKPAKTLELIKELSIDAALNSLVESGISNRVIDPVSDILRQNITTGGSYASMNNHIRDFVLGLPGEEGNLMRHTKQITTDAINQFSAQYHTTIAEDLGLNWGRYVGSNITTTRQFCELLTKKDFVHKSELPEVLKGHIDGVKCKLSTSTGLPMGMIPGTNVSNFKILRGGYNCGHQFYFVPDAAVPENIRSRIRG
jgi:uncharacterized protein YaaR (DUF327 family)